MYLTATVTVFMYPKLREKQMKMDITVDNTRKRFGFYSIQRGGLCTGIAYYQPVMQKKTILYILLDISDRWEG